MMSITKNGRIPTTSAWVISSVQPCVGVWSNKCTSKYGIRRPFILAGSLMISVVVIVIGFSADVGYILGDTREHCRFNLVLVFGVINAHQSMEGDGLLSLMDHS
ncbi:sucrose transport protein SUC3-like isoform X2 [Hibiscus syriacus]|nr:sucrose transport protein SUC3-like isoform X2 [Hibiscus syriacus]